MDLTSCVYVLRIRQKEYEASVGERRMETLEEGIHYTSKFQEEDKAKIRQKFHEEEDRLMCGKEVRTR